MLIAGGVATLILLGGLATAIAWDRHARSSTPAKGDGRYIQPADLCGLINPAGLAARAGSAGPGTPITKGTTDQLSGCRYRLQANDATNTLMIFVMVGERAESEYAIDNELLFTKPMPGYTGDQVTGVGSKAVFGARISPDNTTVNAALTVLDQNLYMNLEFHGDGSGPWEPASLRNQLTAMAAAALAKIQRT
jgi:hypothetical protein